MFRCCYARGSRALWTSIRQPSLFSRVILRVLCAKSDLTARPNRTGSHLLVRAAQFSRALLRAPFPRTGNMARPNERVTGSNPASIVTDVAAGGSSPAGADGQLSPVLSQRPLGKRRAFTVEECSPESFPQTSDERSPSSAPANVV